MTDAAGNPSTSEEILKDNHKDTSDLDWINKAIKQFFPGGMPNDQASLTFLEDELDAQKAHDWFGDTLAGFSLPKDVSVHDWEATLSAADTFASLTGFKYMPTGKMILDAYQQGFFTDPQKAAQFWWQKMPAQAQKDHANAGLLLKPQEYQTSVAGRKDIIENLTGQRDYSAGGMPDINQSLRDNWSNARFEQATRTALSKTDQFAYLDPKYGGFDYNTWQQHKEQDKAAAERRFGDVQDKSYLQMIDNPLQQFHAAGGEIKQPPKASGDLEDYNTSGVR